MDERRLSALFDKNGNGVISDGVPGSARLAFKTQLALGQIEAQAAYVLDKSLKPAKRRK